MSEEATLDDFGGEADNEKVVDEHPRFGFLPDEWRISEISEVAEVVGGSTPSTNNEDYWGGGIPWATPTDITGLSGNTISETEDTLTEEGLESTSTHLLPPKSVLMTSRATIGKCAVNTVEMATNQGFKSLVPSEEVEPWYLHYRMLDTAPFLNSLGSGSTFDEVSKTEVQSVDIPIPPLEEQRKIATVLYTVDRAIEKTEEIVEQATRVRKGLHQTLFREWSEETNKDPLAGEYPADWELKTLSDVVTVTDAEHFTPDYVESGIPVLRPGDLTPGRISLENVEKQVDEETYEELTNRYTPTSDDIVYSRSQNFAVASQIIEDERYCLGQDMVVIEPEELNATFLLHLLNSPVVRNQAIRRSTGSTFSRVNLGDIRSYRVPIPSNEVQRTIAGVIAKAEERIRIEKEIENQLNCLRRGLMQDLLSGTIRTTDTNIEVPEEITQHG
ncbi:restriction endonuclease subunit S [Halomicrobium urmianum]|uniref:restriction endonuclease subunit S n=1 Tax=Halomicrobium urmianum TaxID=1586233 RepID=UPI001CD97040|nr:restriction endonuclease subunit S [Halomicrobium urmianum]